MRISVQRIGRWLAAGCTATLVAGTLIAAAGDNEYVRVQTAISRQQVAAGDTLTLLVSFVPRQGIHVNVDPPVTVELDSGAVAAQGGTRGETDTKTGFLASETPVVQTIVIPRNMATGVQSVRGRIIYFYCSDAEGWCMRSRQPFTVSFTVVPPAARRL